MAYHLPPSWLSSTSSMPVTISIDHSSEPHSQSPLLSPLARGHHHPYHVRLFSEDDGRGDTFNTEVFDQGEGGAKNPRKFQR